MGVLPGFPDLIFIWVDAGRVSVAFIELKSATGQLRPPQKMFRTKCFLLGLLWAECRSIEEVSTALQYFKVPMRNARIAA